MTTLIINNKKHSCHLYSSILVILACIIMVSSCREDDPITPPTPTPTPQDTTETSIQGFYLLNEGNMGMNKATLDYYDYQQTPPVYYKNIYASANPSIIKELGDVGNDLQIYGNKLYAVINSSNKVEVMDVKTTKHITKVDVPNCRYITFHEGKAYVSSYSTPLELNPEAGTGFIAEIDTVTFEITRKASVGFQPEEMVIANNKLYVANSGGYRFPDYDYTVSVVDLTTFKEIKKISVAINLHRLKIDKYGDIYASSRGNYNTKASNIYVIDSKTDQVKDSLGVPASNLCICGDSIYLHSTEYNESTKQNTITYAIVNIQTKEVVNRNFITDGTEKSIKIPYGIAVNPETKDIFITDARDYVTPGTLYCFDKNGKKKWDVVTGDIPAHIAFVWADQ